MAWSRRAPLVGDAWINSAERIRWENRVLRRRVPVYRAGIWALRMLNRMSPAGSRPSLDMAQVFERVGVGGETYEMWKLVTMTGEVTDAPVTGEEFHARTSFASRLARAISADEWPQLIKEYEHRRAGGVPRMHLTGPRDLNQLSMWRTRRMWLHGLLPTEQMREWERTKWEVAGAYMTPHMTHGGARDFPRAEADPGFMITRVGCDVDWRRFASKRLEKQILRRSRIVRAKQLPKFFKAEAVHAWARHKGGAPTGARGHAWREPYPRGAVDAMVDLALKPRELRSPAAHGEFVPDEALARATRTAAAAVGLRPVGVELPGFLDPRSPDLLGLPRLTLAQAREHPGVVPRRHAGRPVRGKREAYRVQRSKS